MADAQKGFRVARGRVARCRVAALIAGIVPGIAAAGPRERFAEGYSVCSDRFISEQFGDDPREFDCDICGVPGSCDWSGDAVTCRWGDLSANFDDEQDFDRLLSAGFALYCVNATGTLLPSAALSGLQSRAVAEAFATFDHVAAGTRGLGDLSLGGALEVVTVKGLDNAYGATLPFQAHYGLGPGGAVQLGGTIMTATGNDINQFGVITRTLYTRATGGHESVRAFYGAGGPLGVTVTGGQTVDTALALQAGLGGQAGLLWRTGGREFGAGAAVDAAWAGGRVAVPVQLLARYGTTVTVGTTIPVTIQPGITFDPTAGDALGDSLQFNALAGLDFGAWVGGVSFNTQSDILAFGVGLTYVGALGESVAKAGGTVAPATGATVPDADVPVPTRGPAADTFTAAVRRLDCTSANRLRPSEVPPELTGADCIDAARLLRSALADGRYEAAQQTWYAYQVRAGLESERPFLEVAQDAARLGSECRELAFLLASGQAVPPERLDGFPLLGSHPVALTWFPALAERMRMGYRASLDAARNARDWDALATEAERLARHARFRGELASQPKLERLSSLVARARAASEIPAEISDLERGPSECGQVVAARVRDLVAADLGRLAIEHAERGAFAESVALLAGAERVRPGAETTARYRRDVTLEAARARKRHLDHIDTAPDAVSVGLAFEAVLTMDTTVGGPMQQVVAAHVHALRESLRAAEPSGLEVGWRTVVALPAVAVDAPDRVRMRLRWLAADWGLARARSLSAAGRTAEARRLLAEMGRAVPEDARLTGLIAELDADGAAARSARVDALFARGRPALGTLMLRYDAGLAASDREALGARHQAPIAAVTARAIVRGWLEVEPGPLDALVRRLASGGTLQTGNGPRSPLDVWVRLSDVAVRAEGPSRVAEESRAVSVPSRIRFEINAGRLDCLVEAGKELAALRDTPTSGPGVTQEPSRRIEVETKLADCMAMPTHVRREESEPMSYNVVRWRQSHRIDFQSLLGPVARTAEAGAHVHAFPVSVEETIEDLEATAVPELRVAADPRELPPAAAQAEAAEGKAARIVLEAFERYRDAHLRRIAEAPESLTGGAGERFELAALAILARHRVGVSDAEAAMAANDLLGRYASATGAAQ
ncbi:hypothetical protein L6V77_10625 [Myxococcota bacterium]|nr:hypothetical protein [Myxococcota bacterium]